MSDEVHPVDDDKFWFSQKGKVFANLRGKSPNGRVAKILGTEDTFSEAFKKAVLKDYEGILEREFLLAELEGAKKVLTALRKSKETLAQQLHKKLYSDPKLRDESCVLCPIWRHEYALRRVLAATDRYIYQRVRSEIYHVTIIFDYAADLYKLKQSYVDAHTKLKAAVAAMNRKRHGVVIIGSFEPDLRSALQFDGNSLLAKARGDLQWNVMDSGGWVLSGHFIVRVPHQDELKAILKDVFPSKDWERVRFVSVYKSGGLANHLMKIMSYAAKYPAPLFDPPTRGPMKKKADQQCREMTTAFYGPKFSATDASRVDFNLDEAIRQWAIFMDQLGVGLIYYSVESVHAQKWYSEFEMDYIRATDYDLYANSEHRIELHRDTGPFSGSKVLPELQGGKRRLVSRPLQDDPEWVRLNNSSPYEIDSEFPNFTRWMKG